MTNIEREALAWISCTSEQVHASLGRITWLYLSGSRTNPPPVKLYIPATKPSEVNLTVFELQQPNRGLIHTTQFNSVTM